MNPIPLHTSCHYVLLFTNNRFALGQWLSDSLCQMDSPVSPILHPSLLLQVSCSMLTVGLLPFKKYTMVYFHSLKLTQYNNWTVFQHQESSIALQLISGDRCLSTSGAQPSRCSGWPMRLHPPTLSCLAFTWVLRIELKYSYLHAQPALYWGLPRSTWVYFQLFICDTHRDCRVGT